MRNDGNQRETKPHVSDGFRLFAQVWQTGPH